MVLGKSRVSDGVSQPKKELKCTEYVTYDYDEPNWYPCNCPVCGGFLKWDGDQPICTKCGADLLAIPERDEDTGEEFGWGKICPISLKRKGD